MCLNTSASLAMTILLLVEDGQVVDPFLLAELKVVHSLSLVAFLQPLLKNLEGLHVNPFLGETASREEREKISIAGRDDINRRER